MNSKTKKILIILISIMFIALFALSVLHKKSEIEDNRIENTVELQKTVVEKKEINNFCNRSSRCRQNTGWS